MCAIRKMKGSVENITGKDVLALIPQRPPMAMVDAFRGIDGDGLSWTGLTVSPDNVFAVDGVFIAPGVIEHMAQSAAARAGYLCMKEGRAVPVGFIASIEKMTFPTELPHTGDTLETSVEVVADIFNMSLVHAVCRKGGDIVAEGNMKIYIQDETQEA